MCCVMKTLEKPTWVNVRNADFVNVPFCNAPETALTHFLPEMEAAEEEP